MSEKARAEGVPLDDPLEEAAWFLEEVVGQSDLGAAVRSLRAENEALRAVLWDYNERFGGIDHGYCAVCQEHRSHDLKGNRQPCPNERCLTNAARRALSDPLAATHAHAPKEG